MHTRRFVFAVLAANLLSLLPGPVCAAPGNIPPPSSPDSTVYLQRLQEKAKARKLWNDPYWRVLLHYKPRYFSGLKSEINSPKFFNAEDGRTNPESELLATITSFFAPEDFNQVGQAQPAPLRPQGQDTAQAQEEVRQHPQCFFPDRYDWLKKELQFDGRLLAERHCEDYSKWRSVLNPSSVTLVFSSYYLNNPASMFGHTLLRLNNGKHSDQERLLDYGVSYGALVTTGNALAYAALGVSGGFAGEFSNVPYYYKVAEYNDSESRDLWEYELSLGVLEIDRLMAHLWAVGHAPTPYYFFDQNCSYMLLALLDAANPEYGLSDGFRSVVIPADTVRVVTKREGLVRRVTYRPSRVTRINRQRLALSPRQNELFQDLVWSNDGAERERLLSQVSTLDDADAVAVLDVALDYLQLKRATTEKQELTADLASLQRELLLARSDRPALLTTSQARTEAPDAADGSSTVVGGSRYRPDWGHETSTGRISTGHNSLEGSFVELGWKPSFHDLNARKIGYPQHAHIELANIGVRFYPVERKLRLERAELMSVMSLAPVDRLFLKPSWSLKIGIDTVRHVASCEGCNEARFALAGGLAADPIPSHLLVYALGEGELAASSAYSPRYRLGPGFVGGALVDLTEELGLHLVGRYHLPILGDRTRLYEASAEGRYSVRDNLDVRLRYDEYVQSREARVTMNVYF